MKRLYKTLCLSALLMCMPGMASALEYVKVSTNSGKPVFIGLEKRPEVRFDNNLIKVEGDDVSFNFPISENPTFSFDDPTQIKDVTAGSVVIECDNYTLTAKGLIPGEEVAIVSLSGNVVRRGISDGDGSWQADISNLAHGIYVITSKSITAKLQIK